MQLPTITTRSDWAGVTVLVRVDFNVPVGDDGVVTKSEAWRIETAMRTIDYLVEHEARVVVVSHIGRDPEESLRPIADYINQNFEVTCGFVPSVTGEVVQKSVDRMGNGQVLLLENLRQDPREVANDDTLAKELASLAEVYVNDAFSVAHREHASIVGVPTYLPAYAGLQFADEVAHLETVREPKQPLVVIVGGAKFETKMSLIEQFMDKASKIFVGGALAHPIFVCQGYEIGQSLVDDDCDVHTLATDERIMVPTEVLVQRGSELHDIPPSEVGVEDVIVDLGYQTIDVLRPHLEQAATILWNGPLGLYEEGFDGGTRELIQALAQTDAYKVVGGGDTVAVIREHQQEDAFDFISTAGGAMLDYLVTGQLPGIEAIQNAPQKLDEQVAVGV